MSLSNEQLSEKGVFVPELKDYLVTDELENLGLGNCKSLLDQIRKSDIIPFSKGNIKYSEDKWDFSPWIWKNKSQKKRIYFSNAPDKYKDILKFYTILSILDSRRKLTTIVKQHYKIIRFLNYLTDNKIQKLEDLNTTHIKDFMSGIKEEYSTLRTQNEWAETIDNFLSTVNMYISSLDINPLLKEVGSFKFHGTDYLNAKRQETPYANIPEPYFLKWFNAVSKIAYNPQTELEKRAQPTALLLLILSQTGMRVGELLALQTTDLKLVGEGESAVYCVEHDVWKTEKGNNTFRRVKASGNAECVKAYQTLIELDKDRREHYHTNCLYLGPRLYKKDGSIKYSKKLKDDEEFSLTDAAFSDHLFFIYWLMDDDLHSTDIDHVPEGFAVVRPAGAPPAVIPKSVERIVRPHSHQFRVHYITYLIDSGAEIDYIRSQMGHVSTQSTMGYYRSAKEKETEKELMMTRQTLEKVITGELKLLGGDESFLKNVQKFIDDNHFNVKKDLQEIVDSLTKKIPIRSRTGGMCIKSSFLTDCGRADTANKLYCAYGVCPNLFHFFYMIDVSLRQIRELEELIKINYSNKFRKETIKQLSMLQDIIRKKFLPEYKELCREMSVKGQEAVLTEHPDLTPIITNLPAIKEEVDLWNALTYESLINVMN